MSVEMCDAPRPTSTLTGDSARYFSALASLHLAVTLAHDGAIPVVVNAERVDACSPSPKGRGVDRPRRKQDTARAGRQPEYDRGTDDLKRKARPAVTLARRFPAIGSFEVYLRTPSGAHQARM